MRSWETYTGILEKVEMTRAVLETRKGEFEEKRKRKQRDAVIEAEGETKLWK